MQRMVHWADGWGVLPVAYVVFGRYIRPRFCLNAARLFCLDEIDLSSDDTKMTSIELHTDACDIHIPTSDAGFSLRGGNAGLISLEAFPVMSSLQLNSVTHIMDTRCPFWTLCWQWTRLIPNIKAGFIGFPG